MYVDYSDAKITFIVLLKKISFVIKYALRESERPSKRSAKEMRMIHGRFRKMDKKNLCAFNIPKYSEGSVEST